jgi:hypothetical protein
MPEVYGRKKLGGNFPFLSYFLSVFFNLVFGRFSASVCVRSSKTPQKCFSFFKIRPENLKKLQINRQVGASLSPPPVAPWLQAPNPRAFKLPGCGAKAKRGP